MSTHTRIGPITEHQRLARIGAGIEPAGCYTHKQSEPLVGGIVALVCEFCGCTNARPVTAKGEERKCGFCGKAPRGYMPPLADKYHVQG